MKNILPLICIILLCYQAVNAQWHEKACGVQDIESATSDEFDCMWNKAVTTVKVGQIACLVGTSIAILGGAVTLVASGTDSESTSGTSMFGALAAVSGLSITAISIPIWAVGASRRSRLMKSPAYQDFQGVSLQVSPTIETNRCNEQASLGLAFLLNF